MLGLNEHADRVSGAYEKVLQCDAAEGEMEFDFDYNDRALASAERQEIKLRQKP